MKINSIFKGLAVIAVMLLVAFGFMHTAYAASKSTTHTVTASVPSLLSISADTSAFTLTFSDYVSGSETDTKTVNYTINGNKLNKATGVVTGQLSAAFAGMDFTADVGAYSKTSGNVSLVEAASGFITIGNLSAASLADKDGAGKKSKGVLPITYKAVATSDLDAGDQTSTLTISVIDA